MKYTEFTRLRANAYTHVYIERSRGEDNRRVVVKNV